MVGPVIIAAIFWLAGILLMIGARLIINRLRKTEKALREKSESQKFNDTSASIALKIGEKTLDYVPWFWIRLVCIIIGLIIIALGFVPLGFIAV